MNSTLACSELDCRGVEETATLENDGPREQQLRDQVVTLRRLVEFYVSEHNERTGRDRVPPSGESINARASWQ